MDSRTLQRRFRLKKRQAIFALEYGVDLNGSQAAIRAGYAERSARITASKLLTKPNVLQAVELAFSERVERLQLDGDAVVEKLAQIAFTDIGAFASWQDSHVTLKDFTDIPPEKLAALAEVQETPQGLRVKMRDSLPALALLARHFGVLPTAGTREATAEHARITYERTVTEKWDMNALSSAQLEQFDDIVRTIRAGQSSADA